LIRQAERNDQLRLLALVGQGLGSKGLAGYQTPGENWAEHVAEAEDTEADTGPERLTRVLDFIAATGGEAG
jgi:hypothetical protein